MNGKKVITTSLLAATCMVFDAGLVFSQTTSPQSENRQEINPNISSPDTSLGGTQSQRTSPGGVPLPECSPFAGTTGKVRNPDAVENCPDQQNQAQNNRSSMYQQHAWSSAQVREAQRALDDKGYDPGPIDGVMGQQTREALRSFQQSNDLPVTGTLTEQTMDQLGVDHNASYNFR